MDKNRISADIDYRLAKWLILNLVNEGLITTEEARLTILKLLEHSLNQREPLKELLRSATTTLSGSTFLRRETAIRFLSSS